MRKEYLGFDGLQWTKLDATKTAVYRFNYSKSSIINSIFFLNNLEISKFMLYCN